MHTHKIGLYGLLYIDQIYLLKFIPGVCVHRLGINCITTTAQDCRSVCRYHAIEICSPILRNSWSFVSCSYQLINQLVVFPPDFVERCTLSGRPMKLGCFRSAEAYIKVHVIPVTGTSVLPYTVLSRAPSTSHSLYSTKVWLYPCSANHN